jgi:NTE family protein
MIRSRSGRLTRHKEIHASRAISHARQKQIHQLRHIIRELVQRLPADQRDTPVLASRCLWLCTTMHIVELDAPRLDARITRDIDLRLTASRVARRL